MDIKRSVASGLVAMAVVAAPNMGNAIGTYNGVELTNCPSPCDYPPQLGSLKYVVQLGDTLSEIAEKYRSKNVDWERIARDNGISDPKKLMVGSELVIWYLL